MQKAYTDEKRNSGINWSRINWSMLIYLGVFLILLIRHIPVGLISDDKVNISNHAGMSLWEVYLERYNTNGRIFTDMAAEICYRYLPFWLWKVLDSAVYVAIAKLLAWIFTDERVWEVLAVSIAVLLYPFTYLWSAGYIATSTNYIYTFLALLLALMPVRYVLRERAARCPWYLYLGCVPGVLYASNHDQYAVVLIGGLLLTGLYMAVVSAGKTGSSGGSVRLYGGSARPSRESVRICGGPVGASAGSAWPSDGTTAACDRPGKFSRSAFFHVGGVLLLTALCWLLQWVLIPGRVGRMTETFEMEAYLPQFAEWSFFKKIYHGFSSTVSSLFFTPSGLISLLFLLIAILALMEAGWLWKILGMLPLALHALIREFGYKHFVVYYDYAFKQPEIGAFSANPKYALTLLIAVVLTALILILPFRLCRGRDRSWLILLLLLLGGGSRLMMGLSPTIYASGYRTYTLLLFAVGICCVLLLKEIWERGLKPLQIAGVAAFAVVFLV